MVKSKLTNQTKLSHQSSSRNGTTIDTFLIHHQASTSDDATIREMVTASKQVSANYTISNEGRITSVVPEELRAWTSGSTGDGGKGAAWDRRSITVEIENQTAAPDWKISDKALDAAAALLHDLKQRYHIKNVLGHRDLWNKYHASYATYCPGPHTVADIVKREAAISDSPKPAPKPKPTSDHLYVEPSAATRSRIQRALGKRKRYNGPADGKWGDATRKGIQLTLKAGTSYSGKIDGNLDTALICQKVQEYAKEFGSYVGPVDKKLGENSWIGFAIGLERP
jgi:hypothetical protein